MNSDNEFDDLNLDRLPGIFDDNYNNNSLTKELQNRNENKMPNFQELLVEPIQTNPFQKIKNEDINDNKIIQKEEETFTFKNINRKEKINRNYQLYNTEINNELNENLNKRIENDKMNADVLNFDDLMKKIKNKKLNKSKEKKDKKENKKFKQIDFSRKLYQNKKNYETEKENKEIKKDKIIKSKINQKAKILFHNKSDISIKSKKIFKNKNSMTNKNINKENHDNLYNYFRLDNPAKKKSNIILNYKGKNIILNYKNNNNEYKDHNNKSIITDDNSRNISLIMNKSSNTLRSKNSKKKKMNIMNDFEDKIKIALKKEKNKKSQKRFSDIKDELIKFDKTKFEKYDTEQIRYGLIKDYSFIHAEKNNDFYERMQFDLIKRKNKEKKINEYVEKNKNKYKLNEVERKKAFNRLIDDANRRIIMKQEIIENEKYLTDYRDLSDNSKKYNQGEWDKIYKRRFKDYEDIKKKKIDIQRQNEKIKKMLKEEEEINMCPNKKIPLFKIKQSSERLFNDSKRREYLRNNNSKLNSDKSSKNMKSYKNKICLTNFNDEEDASKYMKNFKQVDYSFNYDKPNLLKGGKNNPYLRSNNNFDNSNKTFNRKSFKKNNKISVTEFNNIRFDESNNNIIKYPKKKIKKSNNYNLNINNDIIQPYFNYKKNKKKNNEQNYNYISSTTMPCEYNYNNFNIYNINNLNNNINSNLNNNLNNDYNNDNDYLRNLTNQLIQSEALKKINKANDFTTNIYKEITNNINYNNIDNKESEGNQIIEQFLSSQLEY